MNFQDNDIEQIEAWLEGRLDQTARAEFEQRMQKDAAFKEKVEQFRTLMNLVEKKEDYKNLRQLIQEAEADTLSPIKEQRSSYPWMQIAASLMFILTVGLGIFFFQYKSEQQAGYRQMKQEISSIQNKQSTMQKKIMESETERAEENAPTSQATAFAISSEGYVFTSAHVVKGKKRIKLYNETYGTLTATVISRDDKLDLCLLKVTDTSFSRFSTTIPLRTTRARIAEKVFTLGYPKDDIVYGEGVISSLSGYENDSLSLQISIAINPGNSGSPLLDERGQLLGMIEGKADATEGTAYALKNSYILSFIKEIQEKEKFRYQLTPNVSGGRSSIAERLSPGIFRVIVY